MTGLRKDETADSLHLSTGTTSLDLTRLGPGVVLMAATGRDTGQFGLAPFEWLEREMGRHGSIELFVDMRAMVNATQPVSDGWSQWTQRHKTRIRRMNLLVASKYVQMTVEVAKLFSRTGELMRIYTEDSAFAEAITQSMGRPFVLPPRQRDAPV